MTPGWQQGRVKSGSERSISWARRGTEIEMLVWSLKIHAEGVRLYLWVVGDRKMGGRERKQRSRVW